MRIQGIEIHGIDDCISILFLTLRRPTGVFLLGPNELGLRRGFGYSLISLFLGWWGIPWGIIYTPLTIITNFSGGKDVTPEVRALLLEHLALNK